MHSALMSEVANAFAAALPASFLLLQHNDNASPFVACGCLGFLGLIIVGVIALNIALLIWVARDAKSRGMTTPSCG
jgi:hypothetical protein